MKAAVIFAVVAWLALPPAHAGMDEPSESDLRALAERDVARANIPIVEYHRRLGKGEVPQDMLVKLHAARKKACRPGAGPGAWHCEVQMEMTVPNGGLRSSTVLLRLVRGEGGWTARSLR